MFILSVCATVTDSTTLLSIGDITKLAPEMDKARKTVKQLTNSQYLIDQVKKGETIMLNKVSFDNYMKSQVDLMKAYVSNKVPCEFSYAGFFNGKPITTNDLTIKQQWAL